LILGAGAEGCFLKNNHLFPACAVSFLAVCALVAMAKGSINKQSSSFFMQTC